MADYPLLYGGKSTDNAHDPYSPKMLKMTPPEIITFTKSDTGELVGSVDVQNVVKYPVTYKIKTTSPDKFRVRPSAGIVAAGQTTTINVVLQQGPNMGLLSKDKFLIMCQEVSVANASNQEISELWKNTIATKSSVEQHRMKCSIAVNLNSLNSTSGNLADMSKNCSAFAGNGSMTMDPDRQWLHVSNSISQLVDSNRRLESRIKFNQKLQWITVFVFLLLSIAIVYILKIEINNNSSEHCLKSVRGHYK